MKKVWFSLLAGICWLCLSGVMFPAAARQIKSAPPVTPKQPVEKAIAPGERHLYQLELAAGQLLHFTVDQLGTNVVVRVISANRVQSPIYDSLNWIHGKEEVFYLPPETGRHFISIHSIPRADNRPGSYRLTVEPPREPTETDRIKCQALGLLLEAHRNKNPLQAIKQFSKVRDLWRRVGDEHGEAEALDGMGESYLLLEDWDKVFETFSQSLVLWRKQRNTYMEMWTLAMLGMYYSARGESQKGLDSFRPAVDFIEREKIVGMGSLALAQMGLLYTNLGQYQQALDAYERSIQFANPAAYPSDSLPFLRQAKLFQLLGKPEQEVTAYREALERARRGKAPRMVAEVLIALGEADAARGNHAQAVESFEKALAELPEQRLTMILRARALAGLGTSHRNLGKYQAAVEYHTQAASLFQTLHSLDRQAQAEIELALDLHKLGNPQKAVAMLENAAPAVKYLGDSLESARYFYHFARLQKELGNLEAARLKMAESLRRVERLRLTIRGPQFRTSFFANLHEFYEFYIDLLMELHQKTSDPGYLEQAFTASEQARARSLLELLAESRINLETGVPLDLTQAQQDLTQRIRDKTARVLELLPDEKKQTEIEKLEQEIDQLTGEQEKVSNKIRAASPGYANLTQPQPLAVHDIQRQVLDENTLLLEFFLGSERSYLWLVTPAAISGFVLPQRSEIESLIQEVYRAVSTPALLPGQRTAKRPGGPVNAPLDQSIARLSHMLMGNISDKLGTKRLLVVADGDLQALPFGLLCQPAQSANPPAPTAPQVPLVVTHEIVNLPSASTLAVLRTEPRPAASEAQTVAIFADPVFTSNDIRVQVATRKPTPPPAVPPAPAPADNRFPQTMRDTGYSNGALSRLPFTRQEAQAISQVIPNKQLLKQALDFDATLDQLHQTQLSRFRIIHFATHGLFNPKQPALSGIVLSLVKKDGTTQDGFLGLQEIFNLKLQANLVVLSSCKSGLGQIIPGEGLVGLTRGFMYAGTPRVISSLWNVNDEATSEFMKYFYENHLGPKHLSPAAALREAKLTMQKQPRWAAPYYWAAFILQGEYR